MDSLAERSALINPEELRSYRVFGEPLKVFKTDRQQVEWSAAHKRSEYMMYTDDLIGKLDGTIPLDNERVYRVTTEGFREEKRDLPRPDAVIYLDKSARPVRWLVHALWPVLARQPGTDFDQNQIPPEPDSYFLNIDKKDWLSRMKVPYHLLENAPNSMVDFSKLDRSDIARIRALFSTNHSLDETTVDSAWNFPTKLDGRHIMIVDEVKSSGKSLEIAQKLLSMAIPEAVISGSHWARPPLVHLNKGVQNRDGVQFKMAWVPDWYDPNVERGRGVYDRIENWPEMQSLGGAIPSRIAQIGRFVVSTPPHKQGLVDRELDSRSNELREDIQRLAYLVKHYPGRELYRPGEARRSSDIDIDARIESLNGMSFEEWKKRRDELMEED